MRHRAGACAIVLALLLPCSRSHAQGLPPTPDLELAQIMTRTIRSEVLRHYYDTTFGGVDIEARFRAAENRLILARSNSELFAIIAQTLFDLNDSHLIFFPPERQADIHYGFRISVVGDSCFIAVVEAGSDAARQGVRPGDRVIAVDRYPPSRREFWKFEYVLRHLAPRATVTLRLDSAGTGTIREITLASRVRERRRITDLTGSDGGMDYWEMVRRWQNEERVYENEFVTVENRTLVWRMPSFVLEDDKLDEGIDRARRHRALVLDLRGNSGGYIRTLHRLLGRVIPTDFVLDTLRKRRGIEVDTVRARGNQYAGPLFVLIDHRSASAAELFAAAVQLQRRGVVIGDASAGAVMVSRGYPLQAGGRVAALYALSITMADVILPNGVRLEHVGVTPDEPLLPSSLDLRAGRDPVLAYALQRLGHAIEPGAAGVLYDRQKRNWDIW